MAGPRSLAGLRGLLVLLLLFLASCITDVEVYSAEVSRDDLRLRLTLQMCDPSSWWIEVRDVGHRVEVAAGTDPPRRYLGGPDCQHIAIVALAKPLRGREVFDRSFRRQVPVSRSFLPWPYDRERFTPADYASALAAMVACLEARDPEIEASIVEGLDWPTYEWRKERSGRGNMSAPAVDECAREHLDPLRG